MKQFPLNYKYSKNALYKTIQVFIFFFLINNTSYCQIQMRTFYTSKEVLRHELAIRNRGARSMTVYISNGDYRSESKTIEPDGLRVFEYNLYKCDFNNTYINYVFDKNAFRFDYRDIISDWINDKVTISAKFGCPENSTDESFITCFKKYADSLRNINSRDPAIELILKWGVERENPNNSEDVREIYDLVFKYALKKFAIGRTNEIINLEPLINFYQSNYHYSEPISSQISISKIPGYDVEFGSFIPRYGFKDDNSSYKTATFAEYPYFQLGILKNFRLKLKRPPINFFELGIMRGKLLYNNDSTSVFPDIKKGIAYDHLYFKFGKRPEDRTFKKVYVWINWETGLLCNIRKEFSLDNDSIEFSSASKSNLSKIETLKLFIGLGASLVIRNFHLKVGYLGSFNNMWLYEKDGTVPMKFFNSVNVTVSVPIKQSKIYAYRYQ